MRVYADHLSPQNIAAQQNHRDACFALTAWYLVGSPGVLPQSDTEAYLWARKAAEGGLVKAMYAIGYFLEVGIGTEPNMQECVTDYSSPTSILMLTLASSIIGGVIVPCLPRTPAACSPARTPPASLAAAERATVRYSGTSVRPTRATSARRSGSRARRTRRSSPLGGPGPCCTATRTGVASSVRVEARAGRTRTVSLCERALARWCGDPLGALVGGGRGESGGARRAVIPAGCGPGAVGGRRALD